MLFNLSGKKWLQAVRQKTQRAVTPSSQKNTWLVNRWLRKLTYPWRNPYLRTGTLFIIVLSVVGLVYLLRDLPSPTRLKSKDNFAVSTQIFDRHGTLLYEIFGDENRIPIEIETLPPHVLHATIAIEDRRFYSHYGFDIVGITRAFIKNLQNDTVEGGSTITQQLVKKCVTNQ